jgi:hypothetical protein
MSKGKFMIGPGSAKRIYLLKRLFPWLVDAVMEREINKVRRSREG